MGTSYSEKACVAMGAFDSDEEHVAIVTSHGDGAAEPHHGHVVVVGSGAVLSVQDDPVHTGASQSPHVGPS